MAKVRKNDGVSGSKLVAPDDKDPVLVEVPVGDYGMNGYQARLRVHDQLHITHMTKRQRIALAMVYCGLHMNHVTINGRPISSQNDAVRWILDSIADGIGV